MAQTLPTTTFSLAGHLPVRRLGFGSMRLTGPGVWGEPRDRGEAVRVVRRAVELGVNLIDTADSYGPEVAESIIAEALFPYPPGLVIATKAGQARPGPNDWVPLGRPEYLRQQAELSLRRLRLERIDLFQLHRIDPQVPLADQMGALRILQEQGKIAHVGLSEVGVEDLRAARRIVEVVSVQNLYNLTNRRSEGVLAYAEREGMAFIPWFPIAVGKLAAADGPVAEVAATTGATPAQVALAWLLRRSPVMLPIPGTSSVAHLEENMAADAIALSEAQMARLDALGAATVPPPAGAG